MDPITAILQLASTILDKILPDKAAAADAKLKLLDMQLSGDIQNAISQLQVNQAEAANKSVFVAGWRPFVGWACGAAFVYAFIIQPVIQTILVAAHSQFDPAKLPVLNITEMLPVLFGMLGMGALRSWDKQNGAGNGH